MARGKGFALFPVRVLVGEPGFPGDGVAGRGPSFVSRPTVRGSLQCGRGRNHRGDYLDQQQERALPVRDHLKSILEALLEHRQQVAEYLKSDVGKREMQVAWLQQSRVVTLLVEFSQTRCRPDGWTLLADAGRWLRELAGDDIDHMKELYGHGQLRRLMDAAELFEIVDEPTGSGSRAAYRVRSLG